ncbi:hypothetical protein ACPEEZ_09480 [Frigoribacterium sp. 2-23]|uniref:hypothetical protein n=1 Tax=Frigoribacterium sp. 2-23 TaxID=3415006 RepID=UPI003C6F1DE1
MKTSAGNGRRPLGVVLLAALVIIDAVLIGALLLNSRNGPAGEAGPIPTFTPLPDPTSTTSETPSPSATGAVSSDAEAPVAFVAALSATQAWRATAGSCTAGSAVIEQTSDGGATWSPVDTTAFAPKTVLSLTVTDGTMSVLGGVGEDCTPQLWSASALARSAMPPWTQVARGADAVPYVTPGASTVKLSAGSADSPCTSPVRGLASGTTDVVACAAEFATKTGSAGWVTVEAPGLIDLALTDTGYLLAASRVQNCDGVAIQSVNAPLTARSFPSLVGCAPATDLVAGGTVLATTGNAVWLTSNDKTLVSADGGATW